MREREVTMNQFRATLSKHEFKNGITLGKVATIESFDPNTIDTNTIHSAVSYAPYEEGNPLVKYNNFRKNLHIYQLSNSLKHVKVLEVISQQDSSENINLVLEDDVTFDGSAMFGVLEKALAAYVPGSIMFCGLPHNSPYIEGEFKIVPTKGIFDIIPYNDSYMIDGTAAKKLYDAMMPIRYVTNINLSCAIEKCGIESFLSVPNIFVDGSKVGMFTSSLNANNVLVFNGDYMKVRDVTLKPGNALSDKEIKEIETICNTSQCAPHPDFQYMRALFLSKIGRYEEAAKVYESAMDTYNRNLCIVNHESSFLKDYLKVFKYIQAC